MKELVIKEGRPLLNYVIVTADKYSAEELANIYGGIVPAGLTNQLKQYQRVVAISPQLKDTPLKVGNTVLINISRYGVPVQKKDTLKSSMDEYYNTDIRYSVPVIDINGIEHLKLGNNDIEFIIDRFEFIDPPKKSIIETPVKSDLIIPGKGKIPIA